MSKGLTCASHALWQTQCPKQPYEIEATGPDKPPNRFKGSQIYVSPERRHWPVYDPTAGKYVDHAHYPPVYDPTAGKYVDHAHYPNTSTDEETRESLLDLSRKEAWALAPIRIFMDVQQEQPCISTRIVRIVHPRSLAQNQFSKLMTVKLL
jgi:hypothetical protein